MYKPVQIGDKGFFVLIAILAVTLIIISSNSLFAADNQFKSEDELIDETRANIEKHLKDSEEGKAPPRNKEVEEILCQRPLAFSLKVIWEVVALPKVVRPLTVKVLVAVMAPPIEVAP